MHWGCAELLIQMPALPGTPEEQRKDADARGTKNQHSQCACPLELLPGSVSRRDQWGNRQRWDFPGCRVIPSTNCGSPSLCGGLFSSATQWGCLQCQVWVLSLSCWSRHAYFSQNLSACLFMCELDTRGWRAWGMLGRWWCLRAERWLSSLHSSGDFLKRIFPNITISVFISKWGCAVVSDHCWLHLELSSLRR